MFERRHFLVSVSGSDRKAAEGHVGFLHVVSVLEHGISSVHSIFFDYEWSVKQI